MEINVCGKGEGGGSGSHCFSSLSSQSLRQILAACMTDGDHSGVAVWYLASQWTGSPGPSGLRQHLSLALSMQGPLGASTLPRWKGGAINQPIWGAMFYFAIYLSPQSLMGKMGQEGLGGNGWKGFTYLGRGRRRSREAGQRSLPAQSTSNPGARRYCEERNHQKDHTNRQRWKQALYVTKLTQT